MEATMKSFKEYLTESKKTYEFKVKIAGDIPKDFATNLKTALSMFNVESISNAKRTPIQESPIDFPNVKFKEITVFDLAVTYPTNAPMIAKVIHEQMGINEKFVTVRTIGEEYETELNVQHLAHQETITSKNADEALLNTPFEASNNQSLVGEEQKLNFLKSLDATKHTLEEYNGVNDQLFAGLPRSAEQVEQSKLTDKSGMGSPVGTKAKPVPFQVMNGIGKGK